MFTLHTYKHSCVQPQTCEDRLSREIEKLEMPLKINVMGTAWSWLVPGLSGCAIMPCPRLPEAWCQDLLGATGCLREKLGGRRRFLFTARLASQALSSGSPSRTCCAAGALPPLCKRLMSFSIVLLSGPKQTPKHPLSAVF